MFEISGIVQHGKGRGKDLGYPTANIPINTEIVEGIYASQVILRGKTYDAVTFVGAAKTFDETEVFAESYIFDFTKDIYGQKVRIKLLKKLRENKKFKTVEDLIEQIEKDIKNAKRYFSYSRSHNTLRRF